MKKPLTILYIALALFIMLAPCVGLFAPEETREPLSPDDYIAQNIAFKPQLTTLYADLLMGFINETGSDQVLAGRNGFLFFGETMADFYAREPLSDSQVEQLAVTLSVLSQALQAQGIGFTFICAPNKNTLYPEYMPYYAVSAGNQSALTRLTQRLDAYRVATVDTAALLLKNKREALVYHPTDTHWNARGAYLVYRALMASLADNGAIFYALYDDVPWADVPFTGDLPRLYRPIPGDAAFDTAPSLSRQYRTDGVMRSLSDMLISTRSDANALSLLVFRDSFGEALFPYLANNVGRLIYTRAFPPEQSIVAMEPIDQAVLLIAQRNLSSLLSSPPLILAPTCPLPSGAEALETTATVTAHEGYYQIAGVFAPHDAPDYSRLRVVVTHAGRRAAYIPFPAQSPEGEQGFSLCLPQALFAPDSDTFAVVYDAQQS